MIYRRTISLGSAGPIFAIFTPNESVLSADNRPESLFPISQTPHFLAFRNAMGYHYLNVHINSANDASISCETFVKFGPVTPELTVLICECQVLHSHKSGVFRGISPPKPKYRTSCLSAKCQDHPAPPGFTCAVIPATTYTFQVLS